jgi:UDP-GlcNAc:undecaprenyl-phosphate/decaprenyl-phosphate GlcNAc-1-phosphate transferase
MSLPMAPVQIQPALCLAFAAAGIAALSSAALTPVVRRAALRRGAAHAPRPRDLHARPVARWGGVAVHAAFLLGLLLTMAGACWRLGWEIPLDAIRPVAGMLICGTLLSLVGALDDLWELSPGRQLLAQIACASLLLPFNVRVEFLSHPFRAGEILSLGAWSYPLTILWIVGVTNALNWIDGVDGLAAGVGAIAALALAVMAGMRAQPVPALMAAALLGSLLGFLCFNFAPARIFLGGGAPFVGFCLAAIATVGTLKATTAAALVVPLLILGVPILDSGVVILRRLLARQPIYQADQGHLHHRLLARGLTQRQTTLVLYAVSLVLSAAAVSLAMRSP